jgi:hypothetical protein
MTSITINGKEISLHWGALVAEWLWLDTMNEKITSARSDWGPAALFYAHQNWQRCDPDGRKLQATKGDFYTWFENATEAEMVSVFAEYEESKSKDRWDKLTQELSEAVEKKILGATSEGTVTE